MKVDAFGLATMTARARSLGRVCGASRASIELDTPTHSTPQNLGEVRAAVATRGGRTFPLTLRA